MRRRRVILMIASALMAALMIAEVSTAALRFPGAQIFQLVTIVFGMKARGDAYRMADTLLRSQIEYAKQQDQKLEQQFRANELSMREYHLRRVYVQLQRQRYQRLHNLLKREAHEEFSKMFRQEVLAYAAQRLARSDRFVKHTNDMRSFLDESISQLTRSINELKQVERLFWPDEIRNAHESIKNARKLLERLSLLGPTSRKLDKALKQLDEKLEKLREETKPLTVIGMREDLEESRKMTEELRREVANIVGKFRTLQAETIRVTRWASKNPEIESLIGEISAVDQMITAPEVRRAMGDEMQERLKDLGVDPSDPEFQHIRNQYIENLRAHLRKNRDSWLNGKVRLTPADMDRLLIHAVKQVTGEDVEFPKVLAVIKGEITSGKAPLEVELDGRSSKGSLVDHEWRINGSSPSGGPIFSHKFEKPGEYTVSLRVIDRRGKSHTAYRKITVTAKYDVQVAVQVSVEPGEVAPGEKVTISAKTTVQDVENPEMTLIFKVDGRVFEEVKEEGGYDTPTSVVFPVPKDARGGKWSVSVQASVKLPEEIKKALNKESISSSEVTGSFHVTSEEQPGEDLFVGDWIATLRMIEKPNEDVSSEGKSIEVEFSISKSGDEYLISGPLKPVQQVDSVQVEGSTLIVKGWSERRTTVFDEKTGRSSVVLKKDPETVKLTLSEDGNMLTGIMRSDIDADLGSDEYQVSIIARRAEKKNETSQNRSRALQQFKELDSETEEYEKKRSR